MKAPQLALVLTGVLLNAIAQLLLKAGAGSLAGVELRPANALLIAGRLVVSAPIIAGLACYALSVVLWILALVRVEVSVAYPMLSLGYVVNALAAWWLFGEELTVPGLFGLACTAVGVALVVRDVPPAPRGPLA